MIMSFHLVLLNAYTCYYLVDNEAYTAFLAEASVEDERPQRSNNVSLKDGLS